MTESTETTEVGFINRPSDRLPICLRCNKPVDNVSVDLVSETAHGWQGSHTFDTGEVIMTLTCHGETWSASNFRGRLPCLI